MTKLSKLNQTKLITDMRHSIRFTKNKNNTVPETARINQSHSSITARPLQGLSVFSTTYTVKKKKKFECTPLKRQVEMVRALTHLFKYLHREIVLGHGSQVGLPAHLAPDIAV